MSVYEEFYKCTGKLHEFISSVYLRSPGNEKKTTLFFNWISDKSEKVITEDELFIPYTYLPKSINSYEYGKLTNETRNIIDMCYNKLDEHGNEIHKIDEIKAKDLSPIQIEEVVQEMILKRGRVVWVDFGFNIGSEFGGQHPALILKKVGDNLLVLPISSGNGDLTKDFILEVPVIYGFSKRMPRWTSVHRIQQISPKRIVYTNFGRVSNDILGEVDIKLKRNL